MNFTKSQSRRQFISYIYQTLFGQTDFLAGNIKIQRSSHATVHLSLIFVVFDSLARILANQISPINKASSGSCNRPLSVLFRSDGCIMYFKLFIYLFIYLFIDSYNLQGREQ